MAKKPVKKKSAPKKPVKKPVAKAAAKKPAKKVAAKPAAKKATKPAAKAAAKGKGSTKPVKPAKAAAPAKASAPAKVAKPVPDKAAEKLAKKEKAAKAKALEVVETVIEEVAPEAEAVEEVYLTDAEGRRFCRVRDCDQLAVVEAYCRYHYLLHWKKIQTRKKILTEGKLERYIEELTARYPDKFLEMLRKDLRSEKEFLGAIQELEIDESAIENEMEDEAQTYIDEVRGMGEGAGERQEEDF